MQENLVIVESPAKAKTIEKFLGDDFKVMSSYGHIRDLKKKELSIDKETLQPAYVIPKDKEELVKRLRENAKKADKVWLASDEDREGEAISWHLCEVLGLDEALSVIIPGTSQLAPTDCATALIFSSVISDGMYRLYVVSFSLSFG